MEFKTTQKWAIKGIRNADNEMDLIAYLEFIKYKVIEHLHKEAQKQFS